MNAEQILRDKAKELLTNKEVDLVIGYGKVETGQIGPVFIRDANDAERLVWNEHCQANLVTYLKRKEVKKIGKPAIVVKGCEAKALVVLEAEKQIERDKMVVIGMVCDGVQSGGRELDKCSSCDLHVPKHCDIVIGEMKEYPDVDSEKRYGKLKMLLELPLDKRLEYWKTKLARCIKCYACRQNCPLCYCEQCVTDKNRPTRFDTSATLRGNFAWNIVRAFHLAGRCVGCSACTTSCPVGINLDLLNLSLAKVAEEEFGYRAGMDRDALPLIGAFSEEDKEEFIR